MAVQLFTDGLEPADLDVAVWRFLDLQKLTDLFNTSELLFSIVPTAFRKMTRRACRLTSTSRFCG